MEHATHEIPNARNAQFIQNPPMSLFSGTVRVGDTEVDTKHIQRKILSRVGIIFLFREGEFSSSSSSGTVGLVEARTMTKVHGLRVCYTCRIAVCLRPRSGRCATGAR